MRRITLLALLAAQSCALPKTGISLPLDAGRHSEPVEWWYWTGHLATGEGRRFGFQVTFFAFDGKVLVDTAALTDIDNRTHHSTQGARPLTGRTDAQLVRGETRASGDEPAFELSTASADWGFSLRTRPGPAVLHGRGGFLALRAGGSTHYYSRPRLPVSGTITVGDVEHAVDGAAWFDHQWGDLRPAIAAGWDWFGIQLDDGRELMVYQFHPTTTPQRVATWSGAEGSTRVDPQDVGVVSKRRWTSPESGCSYPLGWTVTLGAVTLELAPAFDGQEVVNPHDRSASYWEGVALVTGDATGRAYVELAGYCRAR